MKIVHAADLHLDSALLGLERYEGAPLHRIRGATRVAFQNLVALALDEEASLVLLAGDLFDDDWKDYSTALFFRSQLLTLDRANVDVVWIRGNHDATSQLQKHLDLPKRVRELPVKRAGSVVLDDLGVAVHGQGFATRSVTDNLASAYPAPLSGLLNIGLLHTSVTGREGHAPYAPCSLSELVDKGYDYWALGHVHQREVLSAEPWVVFPGNLQGRHARETGDKGATLIEVSDGRILGAEPRALDVVRFSTCRVDAQGCDSPEEVLDKLRGALVEELDAAGGRLLAARVIVEGATRAHATISRDPERWLAEVRALGTELGGEDLWVEKIRFATRDYLDLAELCSRDDAIAQVFRGLAELRQNGDARAGIARELATLVTRLPQALRSGPDALDWESPAGMEALLEDVEQLLLPRLSGGDEG